MEVKNIELIPYIECCTKCHSRTLASNVLRLCTKDEMPGAEDEAEGSVLTYVTKAEFRKQLYVPWHPYGSLGVADRLRATVS
ncbi:MAG: hypothetical protein PUJ69_00350 [Porphyromonas somerae]|nr:hypothetical protein [Porphyromonas somerae]